MVDPPASLRLAGVMRDLPGSAVARLVGTDRLDVHFQPIVSLRTGQSLGHEALLRGYDGKRLIPPPELFQRADQAGLGLTLERAARALALDRFRQAYPSEGASPMLFLNFSARLVDDKALSPGRIAAACHDAGIPPARVALEIVESGVEDLPALRAFAERNRASGFLISLDDFGTQHSNLERVALVRPDIIKIDRSIVSGAQRDSYRRSVLRSVTYLARTVGAFALAEGVESYDDLLAAATEGVDLAQGYLFGRPGADLKAGEEHAEAVLADLLPRLTRDLSGLLADQTARQHRVTAELDGYIERLRRSAEELRDTILEELVAEVREVECSFLLEPGGRQVSSTVLKPGLQPRRSGSFFRPARRGESHTLKDYVYALATLNQERYLTNVYVSNASGRLCRTLAVRFTASGSEELVLCVDIAHEEGMTLP